VDRLEGSEIARARARAVLETVAGLCGVEDACERLEICEQRFHQLRHEIMEGAMMAAEPGRPGRRPQTLSQDKEQIECLRQQVAELQRELQASKAREEIALDLSGRRQAPVEPTPEEPEKKTTPPPRRGRPPGTRKST
jgi:hypothetical protein